VSASPKARRALTHRNIFRDALTWLDVHGSSPDAVADWKALVADQRSTTESPAGDGAASRGLDSEAAPFKRKRRRRRRRVRPAPTEQ